MAGAGADLARCPAAHVAAAVGPAVRAVEQHGADRIAERDAAIQPPDRCLTARNSVDVWQQDCAADPAAAGQLWHMTATAAADGSLCGTAYIYNNLTGNMLITDYSKNIYQAGGYHDNAVWIWSQTQTPPDSC